MTETSYKLKKSTMKKKEDTVRRTDEEVTA